MKTSSCKAKGRELCKTVKSLILETFPQLQDDDIKVTSSGATGEDLQLSPKARELLPVSFECKNHKAFSVYKHYQQSISNSKGYEPVLIIRQNRSDPLVVIALDYYMDLIKLSLTKKP